MDYKVEWRLKIVGANHCDTELRPSAAIFSRASTAVIEHQDQRQHRKERVYFMLLLSVGSRVGKNSRQKLKQRTVGTLVTDLLSLCSYTMSRMITSVR